MKLHELVRTVTRSKKRLGRGHGSGRGKTAGRGTKGQKARGTVPQDFEGGQLALTKRVPLMRGKGRNKSRKATAVVISLTQLSQLPSQSKVTMSLLMKHGFILSEDMRVKIVSNGEMKHALTIEVPCSKSAAAKIEKAGGTVTVV